MKIQTATFDIHRDKVSPDNNVQNGKQKVHFLCKIVVLKIQ